MLKMPKYLHLVTHNIGNSGLAIAPIIFEKKGLKNEYEAVSLENETIIST